MTRRTGTIKNILAAFGAVFFILIFISLLSALLSGEDGLSFSDKVAVLKISGIITDPSDINRYIEDLAERDDVKAVVLRIDSPGGGVGPSQEIYREVIKLKEKKKVVVSMGSVAASGGYYIASAAHRIVANPGTITGSIGVIIEFMNVEELLKKVGLKGYVIKSGRFKDIGSPLRKMSKEEKKFLQKLIDEVHSQFVEAVAKGRNLDVKEVRKIADGRIFTGAQAKRLGLVDELGNLADAVDLSGRLAGIKGKPKVIYPQKGAGGLWKALFDDDTTALLSDIFSGLRVMYLLKYPGT